MPTPVTDELAAEVIARLRHDLAATLGDDHEQLVCQQVASIRTFVDEAEWFVRKVIEDVQQRLHDERIDTVWPRCPRHHRHPLWEHDGAWVCEQDGIVVARVGQLARSAGEPVLR
jgi:hypothetical protein